MTPEEARAELMKRFPNQTVLAETKCWHHNFSEPQLKTTYTINYSFKDFSCSCKFGDSFEECFTQLDEENKAINDCIGKYNILLRKFD